MLLSLIATLTTIQAQGWANSVDGSGWDEAYNVAVDNHGAVYIVGQFEGIVSIYNKFNLPTGSMQSANSDAAVVIKINAENGSFIWAARLEASGQQWAYTVSTDSTGAVYAGGQFNGLLEVYDSKGQLSSTIMENGTDSTWLVKYQSNGSLVWVTKFESTTQAVPIFSDVDSSDNLYISGKYTASSQVDFYDSQGVIAKSLAGGIGEDGYLAKYRSNGSVVYAIRISCDFGTFVGSVSVDVFGSMYIAGEMNSLLRIYDVSNTVRATLPSGGTYVVKYLQNGTYLWSAKTTAGYSEKVVADYIGNVYSCVSHPAPVQVFKSNGQLAETVPGTSGFFSLMVKFTSNGSYAYSLLLSNKDYAGAYSVTVDLLNNVIVGGMSSQSQLLSLSGPNGIVITQQFSVNSGSSFIAKFNQYGQPLWLCVNSPVYTADSHVEHVYTDKANNVYAVGTFGFEELNVLDSASVQQTTLRQPSGAGMFLIKYSSDGLWNSSLTSSLPILTTTAQHTILSSSSATVTSSLISIKGVISQGSEVTQITATSLYGFELLPLSLSSLGPQFHTQTSASQVDTFDLLPSSLLGQNLIVLIFAGTAAVIAIAICSLCLIRRSCRRKRVRKIDVSETGQTTYTQMDTALVTASELAMPGFLEMIFGVDFRSLGLIATGGGGTISHCQVLDHQKFIKAQGLQLVVKSLNSDLDKLTEVLRNSFNQEVAMLWMLRDQPYFVKMFGYSIKPATIIIQYYPSGSLTGYILKHGQLGYTKSQVLTILRCLGQGFAYLHSKHYAHCDIKPDNVLIEFQDGVHVPYITDFGISRQLDASQLKVKAFSLSFIRGLSITYASPEALLSFRRQVYRDAQVMKAGDVFSYAVMLQQMLKRQKPWL